MIRREIRDSYKNVCVWIYSRDSPQSTYIPRVPQCLSPRPNWAPPGCGTHSPAGKGAGGPNSDDWKKKLSTLVYSVGKPHELDILILQKA